MMLGGAVLEAAFRTVECLFPRFIHHLHSGLDPFGECVCNGSREATGTLRGKVDSGLSCVKLGSKVRAKFYFPGLKGFMVHVCAGGLVTPRRGLWLYLSKEAAV